MFPNNTALIKTKFGKHEVMYNFNMLKHYHEEDVKKMAKSPEEAEKDLNPEPPKRTYSKRIIENRPDGGPVTRSRSMQQQQQANGAKIPYAAVVKNSPAKNLADQVNAQRAVVAERSNSSNSDIDWIVPRLSIYVSWVRDTVSAIRFRLR